MGGVTVDAQRHVLDKDGKIIKKVRIMNSWVSREYMQIFSLNNQSLKTIQEEERRLKYGQRYA